MSGLCGSNIYTLCVGGNHLHTLTHNIVYILEKKKLKIFLRTHMRINFFFFFLPANIKYSGDFFHIQTRVVVEIHTYIHPRINRRFPTLWTTEIENTHSGRFNYIASHTWIARQILYRMQYFVSSNAIYDDDRVCCGHILHIFLWPDMHLIVEFQC